MWILHSRREYLKNFQSSLPFAQRFDVHHAQRWMCRDCEMNQIISCNTKSNQIWLSFIFYIHCATSSSAFSLSCYAPEPFSITLISRYERINCSWKDTTGTEGVEYDFPFFILATCSKIPRCQPASMNVTKTRNTEGSIKIKNHFPANECVTMLSCNTLHVCLATATK